MKLLSTPSMPKIGLPDASLEDNLVSLRVWLFRMHGFHNGRSLGFHGFHERHCCLIQLAGNVANSRSFSQIGYGIESVTYLQRYWANKLFCGSWTKKGNSKTVWISMDIRGYVAMHAWISIQSMDSHGSRRYPLMSGYFHGNHESLVYPWVSLLFLVIQGYPW